MSRLSRYRRPSRETIQIIVIYTLSTLFFVYQHSTGISWDYSVYLLNGRYLFGDGFYFEWLRPPLAPVIMGLLGIFGWTIAEYGYILVASALLAFSAVALSRKLETEAPLFYCLLLTPFVYNAGFIAGTELLYLATVTLFLSTVGGGCSGLFLALAILTRYNAAMYLPILLSEGGSKKVAASIILLVVGLSPWLLYNWAVTGDPLTSIADSYGMNMTFRYEYMNPNVIRWDDLLTVAGLYLPLALAGVCLKIRGKKTGRWDWIMLLTAILTLVSYLRIPIKDPRYLIILTIPLAYYTAVAIRRIGIKKYALPGIFILNLGLAFLSFAPLENTWEVRDSISSLDGCMIQSNRWPYYNYLGYPCEPYPSRENIRRAVEAGKRVILFKYETEPDYLTDREFISSLPVIEETDSYILIGDTGKCAPETKVELNYLQALNERGVDVRPIEVFLP